MKKIILIIMLIGIIGAGWFLVSPLFINKTVDEELPITSSFSEEEAKAIVALGSEEEVITKEEGQILLNKNENPYQEIIDTGVVTEIIESKEIQNTSEPEPEPEPITNDKVMDDPMPESVTQESKTVIETLGNFVSKNNYSGSGQVKFIQDGDIQTLRFEDFSVTNGPDLFVTLNKGNSPKGEHIILQKLKGNKGNQNYDISNYDLDDYDSVSIYCRAFSREFATASL
jgi:hypothetical protein